MIIWRGQGYIVLLIWAFVWVLLTHVIQPLLGLPDPMFTGVLFVLSAFILAPLGLQMNQPKEMQDWSPMQQSTWLQDNSHTMYFIRVEHWAAISFILGLGFGFYDNIQATIESEYTNVAPQLEITDLPAEPETEEPVEEETDYTHLLNEVKKQGALLYQDNCASCHNVGMVRSPKAPRLGSTRFRQSMEIKEMLKHAQEGCMENGKPIQHKLTPKDISLTVTYMRWFSFNR